MGISPSLARELIENCGLDPAKVLSDPEAPKPRKFRNTPTEYKGIRYDSKAEARRAEELDGLLAAGDILAWERQPSFRLGVDENVYRADFRVVGKDRGVWIEDCKGVATPKFNRDLKLWQRFGPHPLHVLRRQAGGWERTIIEGIGR